MGPRNLRLVRKAGPGQVSGPRPTGAPGRCPQAPALRARTRLASTGGASGPRGPTGRRVLPLLWQQDQAGPTAPSSGTTLRSADYEEEAPPLYVTTQASAPPSSSPERTFPPLQSRAHAPSLLPHPSPQDKAPPHSRLHLCLFVPRQIGAIPNTGNTASSARNGCWEPPYGRRLRTG